LRNKFIDITTETPILPFRQQNDLTRPMHNESGKQGLADYISLWAGRGVTRARAMPAAELMKTLLVEIGRA
jgi:nitronate monooxygenase